MPPLGKPERLMARLDKAAETAAWRKTEETEHGGLTSKARGVLSRHSATRGTRIGTTRFVATNWVNHPDQADVRLRLAVPELGSTVGVPEAVLEIEVPDARRNGQPEVFPLASFGVAVNHTHDGDTFPGTGTVYHEDGRSYDAMAEGGLPPAVDSGSELFGDIGETIGLIGDHFDANPAPGSIAAQEAGL